MGIWDVSDIHLLKSNCFEMRDSLMSMELF